MLVPSAIEVLESVQETLEKDVRPTLQNTDEKSALASISHLLRHVALRIEHEGQILTDEIVVLQGLLTDIHEFCSKLATPEAEACQSNIDKAKTKARRDEKLYPSLVILSGQVTNLRQVLQDGLIYLQQIRLDNKDDPEYLRLRKAIRDYLVEDIRQEARLIEPAFVGQGPRR